MWANPTLSSILHPPITTTVTTTTRNNHRPFTVTAKPPRPRKNIQYDYEDEEPETDQQLEALKQQQVDEDNINMDPPTYVSSTETISGSAVLLALQKASASKTLKKVKKKGKSKYLKGGEDVKESDGIGEDYGDVKELRVKSDWVERLDDLEVQLSELVTNI